ncbi:thioredoxin family protein [Corticicoccus populi]|uniref:Thioredoxin family protein n=1 Tax=Corticicoccus populi TaxID=1812821 RepID=A0ABW5WU82_9STAP
MGNKIFYLIIAVVVVIFAGTFFYMNSQSNSPESLSDSGYYPYTDIDPEVISGPTVDTLDDENYHYNHTPDEIADITQEESAFVYYWSPTCPHCQAATPLLIEAFDNEGAELNQLNVLEYEASWQTYQIESTPTLIYFENGEEVDRITGNPGNVETYESFISEHSGE